MKLSKCHFFAKKILYLHHVLSTTGIKPLLFKTAAIKLMNPPKNAKQVRAILGTFTHHDAKFTWISSHLTAFNTLKSALLEATILHYQDPSKCHIVYTDASDDTVKLNYHKNMMVKNLQLHSFPTSSGKLNENGALQNRKPMAFTML